MTCQTRREKRDEKREKRDEGRGERREQREESRAEESFRYRSVSTVSGWCSIGLVGGRGEWYEERRTRRRRGNTEKERGGRSAKTA